MRLFQSYPGAVATNRALQNFTFLDSLFTREVAQMLFRTKGPLSNAKQPCSRRTPRTPRRSRSFRGVLARETARPASAYGESPVSATLIGLGFKGRASFPQARFWIASVLRRLASVNEHKRDFSPTEHSPRTGTGGFRSQRCSSVSRVSHPRSELYCQRETHDRPTQVAD